MDDTPQSHVDNTAASPVKISLSDSGDVVFVLQDKRELVASSHILSHASKAFKAMMGANFAEGQQPRSAQQPLVISLPEDGPDAVIDFCSVVHGKPLCNQINADAEDHAIFRILGLAVMADKYDSINAVQDSAIGLLARFVRTGGTDALGIRSLSGLVLIAHLLCLPRYFTIFTSRLVMDFDEQYSTLTGTLVTERIGVTMIVHLEEQRSAARLAFMEEVERMISKTTYCKQCRLVKPSKSCTFELFEKLFSQSAFVDGIRTLYTRSLAHNLSCLRWSREIEVQIKCGACQQPTSPLQIHRAQFAKAANDVDKIAYGLCYLCVNAAEDTCTHKDILLGYAKEHCYHL